MTEIPLAPGNDRIAFEVWKVYEEEAKHFNEMILSVRTQALGGVTAVSTILGIFFNKDSFGGMLRWDGLGAAFLILAVLWIALACLDLFYYNRLLLGAVAAIQAVEEESKLDPTKWPGLNLSTRISSEVKHPSRSWPSVRVPVFFYGIVLSALLAVSFLAFAQSTHSGL